MQLLPCLSNLFLLNQNLIVIQTSEIQGTEKHSHPASPLEEVSKSSGIVTSDSTKERCIGQIVKQGEHSVEKPLGPTI